ncbi:hypothetical protein HDU82_004805 [Entophlyctis luteolus]|nr:hypothetical protein HDU82_004805 [Entophlyctis luteolus]
MSHFSDVQIRRFRFLFNKYSQSESSTYAIIKHTQPGGNTNALLPEAPSSWEIAADKTSWLLKVNFKITPFELTELMLHFGPAISLTQARDFIYEYDSCCTGSLDFDDFIEFLGDYLAILQVRIDTATKHYADRMMLAKTPNIVNGCMEEWNVGDNLAHSDTRVLIARHFIQRFPDEASYLASLYLDDPEGLFTGTDSMTSEMLSSRIVCNMAFLKRTIVVRVYSARNLMSFARLKKRPKKGIEYASLDPIIRIELASVVQETSAKISTPKPDWDQDLTFNITIPPGEIHDVMQWVDRQVMTVSLLDFEGEVAQYTEVIAQSCIPLLRILMSVKKPMWQVVKLNPVSCMADLSTTPCVELSITDNTREEWTWAKVVDAYIPPEEVWMSKYGMNVKNDMQVFTKHIKSASGRMIDILQRYESVARPLRIPFRRRYFPTIALNEFNQFVPLTSLVTRLTLPVGSTAIKTPSDACMEVARIPTFVGNVERSKETMKLMAKHLSDAEESRISNADFTLELKNVAGWSRQHFWANSATHNFFGQVASPQTMLLRRKGTQLEHAILLCNLLIGLNMPSFIAIGKGDMLCSYQFTDKSLSTVKRRPYVWVVSILKSNHPDYCTTSNDFDDFSPYTITYEGMDQDSVVFHRKNFRQMSDSAKRQNKNKELTVIHWDPVTDASAESIQRPIRKTSTTTHGHDDRAMVSALAVCIQQYRRHERMILHTRFHRAASKLLQNQLGRFEAAHVQQMQRRASSASAAARSNLTPNTVGPHNAPLRNSVLGESMQRMLLVDNHKAKESSGCVGLADEVHRAIVEFAVPDRCFYRGTVLQFASVDVDAVLEQLAVLGVLDAAIPGMAYVLAARIFRHEFGVTLWVGVGYLADLLAKEVFTIMNPVNK